MKKEQMTLEEIVEFLLQEDHTTKRMIMDTRRMMGYFEFISILSLLINIAILFQKL